MPAQGAAVDQPPEPEVIGAAIPRQSGGAAALAPAPGGPVEAAGDTDWEHRLARAALAVDSAAILAATWPVLLLNIFHTYTRPLSLSLGLLLPVLWIAAMAITRGYEPRFLGVGSAEFRRVAEGAMRLLVVIALVSFAFRLQFSRGLVVVSLPGALALTLAGRYLVRRRLHRRRREGRDMHRVLLVGPPDAVADHAHRLARAPSAGLQVVGACVPEPATSVAGVPVLGGYRDVVAVVRRLGCSTVAIAASEHLGGVALRKLAWDLESTGTDMIVAPNLIDCVGPRLHMRPVEGLPFLHIEAPRFAGTHWLLKSSVDRVVALVVLLLLAPLLVAIAAAVRLSSPGPALFRQTRTGLHGREFRLLKFRTMLVGAEEWLPALLPANDGDGPLFKLRSDPRVTRLGRFLRRYSLDELPQLLNVVRGDMSLVGPRPPLPSEVSKYEEDVRRRLRVPPGLTGLWQVSGRSNLSWEESVRLDLFYVENWSLALDAVILWKTLPAVFRAHGAY